MTLEISTQALKLALGGGLLIGASAAILLLFNGRVAGISGITGNLLLLKPKDIAWRIAFLFGLMSGGFLFVRWIPAHFDLSHSIPYWRLAIAGLLVGFGSRLGGGCTSGHGVCGVSRLSQRSILATLTFMATGFLTVFFLRLAGFVS